MSAAEEAAGELVEVSSDTAEAEGPGLIHRALLSTKPDLKPQQQADENDWSLSTGHLYVGVRKSIAGVWKDLDIGTGKPAIYHYLAAGYYALTTDEEAEETSGQDAEEFAGTDVDLQSPGEDGREGEDE